MARSMWVANALDGTVTQLDLDGNVINDAKVGNEPNAITFDGESVWTANMTETTATRVGDSPASNVNVEIGIAPRAATFDGERVWIASYVQDTLTVIERDGSVFGVFPSGRAP